MSQNLAKHSQSPEEHLAEPLSEGLGNFLPRTLILGAGPSGLGTALGLSLHDPKRKALIVEKKSKPGGLSGSFQWKGHCIDFGPHRLSPNLKHVGVLATEFLGSDLLMHKSQHGVQFKGKLYQFPPRVMDWFSLKSIWILIRLSFSFCLSKVLWITQRFSADTFQSMVERKFGRVFFEWIAKPMSEKVWTSSEAMDPQFVTQRFSLVEPSAILKRVVFPRQELNPSTFFYPRKGYQQLWESISNQLNNEGHQVLLDSMPTRIEIKQKQIVRVVLSIQGKERVFEGSGLQVVSTIPILHLLRLMEGDLDFEEMKEKAMATKIRSMILVVFEFEGSPTLPFRTHIYPESEFIFNRLFEQNQYSKDTVRAGTSVVVADITLPRDHPQTQWSSERWTSRVLEDLKKLSYIDVSKIRDSHVERVEFAYVVPEIQTRLNYKDIHQSLRQISNLELLGRFSTGEYDNSDYAIDAGLSLGALLAGKISKLEYLCHAHEKHNRMIVG